MKRTFVLLTVAWIAFSGVSAASQCGGYLKSSEAFAKQMKEHGAATVLDELWKGWINRTDKDSWWCLRRSISTGAQGWLDVAKELVIDYSPGTDHLLDSLAQALDKNPQGVLRIVKEVRSDSVSEEEICGPRILSEGLTIQEAKKLVKQHQLALSEAFPKDLLEEKSKCVEKVRDLEANLSTYVEERQPE